MYAPSSVFKPPKKFYLHRAEVVESRSFPRSWEGEVNVFGFQRLAIRHLFFAAVVCPSVRQAQHPFHRKAFSPIAEYIPHVKKRQE